LFDWQKIASDPSIAIAIPEGELKSLALGQCEIPAPGIGGLWSWLDKLDTGESLCLPDLDLFVWQGRSVEIVPDSDVWKRPDLLKAVFALSMTLVQRGAAVKVVKIEASGPLKAGIDDFLVSAPWPREAFQKLERLDLAARCFKDLHAWWQRRQARQAEAEAAKNGSAEKLEIEEVGSCLQFRSAEYGVIVSLDRIQESRRGISAELTAYDTRTAHKRSPC
jgi:hypothetical protein